MSTVQGSYTYEMDASYAADFSRDREPMKTRSRHPEYRRKGSAPTRVNGMHCRRNKRWTWGSGRGARMTNLRAFASCVAVAMTMLASSASAQVTFDWRNIGNAGNTAYTGNAGFPGGVGGVGYDYRMSRTETTRGQYAAFLNAVATNTSAPSYVQNLWSGSTNFGITRTVSGGAYTYSVSGNSQLPITNVSWTMAARFVNWLNNGQQTLSAAGSDWNTALNTGAYTLATSNTSSQVVARNPGYTTPGLSDKFFLPSANEWVKAAFYNPAGAGSWNVWQTSQSGSSPTPTATSVASGASNAAVYNTGVAAPGYAALPVGSIPNTQSPYGLYDMLGNVTEMTDTAGTTAASVPNGWYAVSAGFATPAANIAGWNINGNRYLTDISSANGFRVAGVAAVPEPETITLAAFGMVGLCGANWLKRRRKSGGLTAPESLELAA